MNWKPEELWEAFVHELTDDLGTDKDGNKIEVKNLLDSVEKNRKVFMRATEKFMR